MGVTFYKYSDDGTLKSKSVKSEYNAKVYPMVCDRLTLTCNIPKSLKHQYVKLLENEKYQKNKNGYKLSVLVKDIKMKTSPYLPDEDDKITSAYIQYAPYDDSNGFLRLDFNPAKVDMTDLKGIINGNYLTHPNYGFDYVLEHGTITRIDFAVDIDSEAVENLYYYYDKMQRVEIIRSFRGQTEYIQGEVEYAQGKTEYLGGKIKPAKRVAIYDRLPAIKAHNYKKFYNKKLHIPEPINDIMRVEVRLFRLKKSLNELLLLKNPFEPLAVSSLHVDKDNDPLWGLFIALARFEGAQSTIARLPDKIKKQYREKVKKGKVGWWKPKKIWEQLPTVINSITDA